MNIFDRLPDGLFGPLTGKNQRRAWELISRLVDQFFGPDCVAPYADGYLHDQVVKEIERFLLDQTWEQESADAPATPVNIQANMLLTRLVESGWLVEDRIGVRTFVGMQPAVARFFETLNQFAIEGPQLIGGNIQLIHNQLKSVAEDPKGQAPGFQQAAMLCVRLINSLHATTLRARDLMKELTQEQATDVFVRRFFAEHIAELYVRDFRELRTENHPLRLRYDIIELVDRVTSEEAARSQLLEGYRQLPGARLGDEAAMLEKDVERFRRLLDVERYLDRMDSVMQQSSQRALAYLSYRLKATERMEVVIADSIDALLKADAAELAVTGRLMPPQPLVSEERMRLPPPAQVKPVRKPMVKREMTLQEKAQLMLRKAMLEHRDATPLAMRRYVEDNLPMGQPVSAEQLPSTRPQDAVAYAVLLRLAVMAKTNPRALRSNPLFKRLGFESTLTGDGRKADTELFTTNDFTVLRRSKDAS